MKPTFLSLCMTLVCAGALMAQPTIPGSKFFVPGNTLTYVDGQATSISPGNAGANQTWDFSNVTSGGSGYTDQYVSAASTPYASSFPTSNVATTDPNSFDINYIYITTNGSSLTFNGMVLDYNGVPVNFIYTNPQQYFTFPLAYNSNHTDTYAGSGSVSLQGITMENYRYGSVTTTVDGYGTLITPTGSFPNCLRIKIREVYTDSTVYVGIPVPADLTINKKTSYLYMDGNGTIAVDRFKIEYDTTIDASGTTVDQTIQYLSGVTTGVTTVMPAETIKLYPNPANSELFINPSSGFEGAAMVSILDLSGRQLSSSEMTFLPGTPVSIPVSQLTPGTYLVHVYRNGETSVGRFIRQ